MKQLFLSHYSKHAEEINLLARALRYRGVRPWVDKQGGFRIADNSAVEAKRAITDDCLGFLLYATDDVFGREFIRDHEVPHALAMRQGNEKFLLFAVPRSIGFEHLSKLSELTYGADLAAYHTRPLEGTLICGEEPITSLTDDILTRVLQEAKLSADGKLIVQFSTRELAPPETEEVLTIDGREAYRADNEFPALIKGMSCAKREIARTFGRPTLQVHGFKHLSAAFAFGRVFQPFEILVRQTPTDYWSLSGTPGEGDMMSASLQSNQEASDLVVQVSSGFKNLTPAAEKVLEGAEFSRLELRPIKESLHLDENLCRDFVQEVYKQIEQAVSKLTPARIHLFGALPQAAMMGLGQKFAGMPEAFVYDFDGEVYGPPRIVPSGVL